MALIKCTNCGHMISDKATKCPKCGCPTTKGTESHIPQEKPQVQPVYYEEEEGGRSRKWLYGIIVLLVVIIAGGCYWWYSQTSDKRVDKQLESDNVSEIKMSVDQFEKVGTLSAYYAKEDIEHFKKGQLICDSNDPINRIVDNNATHYKYEGDDTGVYYSYLLPKSKVDKKTYTMYQLPVALIGKRAVFVSNEGDSAKIFQSNINKHKYWDYDIINGEYKKRISYEETDKHSACYVLSIILPNGYLFEQPLEEQLSNVRLYRKNPYGDGVAPSDCRYREGEIGIIEGNWIIDNYDEWPDGKSAYDADGRLLVDQCRNDGIPGYISIAFLPALDALYIDGDLYYRKK